MTEKNGKTDAEPLKKCFVIMPISDVPDYPSGHFNRCLIISLFRLVSKLAIRQFVQMLRLKPMSSLLTS